MRAEILDIENRDTIEKRQITSIRNKRDVISTDFTDIRKTVTQEYGRF